MEKTVVSGIRPTGIPHVGNYFGAIRQLVELQKEHTGYVFIANYHGLTTLHDKDALRAGTLDVAASYLAAGLDPKRFALFLQSDVPEVTELGWIFECLVTVPYLMRGTSYKDASMAGMEVTAGILNYPALMAADILMYGADMVPVGADQKQHIEMARDIAEKFNRTFGETFVVPEPFIIEKVRVVPGTDGRKMSKSYGNTISMSASRDEIAEAVMRIPTDSKGVEEPKETENSVLLALYALVATPEELASLEGRYRSGGVGYKEAKELLIEAMERFIAPMREKKKALMADPDGLRKTLAEGGARARERARTTMNAVRKATGFAL